MGQFKVRWGADGEAREDQGEVQRSSAGKLLAATGATSRLALEEPPKRRLFPFNPSMPAQQRRPPRPKEAVQCISLRRLGIGWRHALLPN